jgi:hypothetical protein
MSISKSISSAKPFVLFGVRRIVGYTAATKLFEVEWHPGYVNQDQFLKDFSKAGRIVHESCSCPCSATDDLCLNTSQWHNYKVSWYNTLEPGAFFDARGLQDMVTEFVNGNVDYEVDDSILHDTQHGIRQGQGWRSQRSPSTVEKSRQYETAITLAAAPIPPSPVRVPPTPPNTPVKLRRNKRKSSTPRRDPSAAPVQQSAPKRLRLDFDSFDVGAYDITLLQVAKALISAVRKYVNGFSGELVDIKKIVKTLTVGGKYYEEVIETLDETVHMAYTTAKSCGRFAEGSKTGTKYILTKATSTAHLFIQKVLDFFEGVAANPALWLGFGPFTAWVMDYLDAKCISYNHTINISLYTKLFDNGLPSYLYYMNKFNSKLLK